MKKALCIYHRKDLDGLACAAVAKNYYGPRPMYELELKGWDYHDNHRKLILDIFRQGKYDEIVMADLSLPMTLMDEIATLTDRFFWFDHHKSAIEEFEKTPNPNIKAFLTSQVAACEIFSYWVQTNGEMYRSENQMVVPRIIHLLGTYDTFRKNGAFDWQTQVLPLQVAISSKWQNDDTEVIDIIAELCDFRESYEIDDITAEGMAILAFERQEMQNVLKRYSRVEECEYLFVNSTHNPARLADLAFEKNPSLELAVIYRHASDGKWSYSLRSPRHGKDCSEIAKWFGGGGHRNAAGFVFDKPLTDISTLMAFKNFVK